jgi:transposase-like protein
VVQTKGIWDGTAAARPFKIQRYLCKHSGKTISLHPQFSQSRKRYPLSTAMPALGALMWHARSVRGVAAAAGVARSTVSRWRRGMGRHEQQKRQSIPGLCGGADPPGTSFVRVLLDAIVLLGGGELVDGTAQAMLCLAHAFDRPLY